MPKDAVDHAFQYAPGEEAPLPEAVGRFRVMGRAGGSQATVFKAKDPDSGRVVAIKAVSNRYDSFAHSLLIALLGDADMEEIRREAELLVGLRHPNIVSVIEVGEDATLGAYLVMEWVDGGNLRARLDGAEGGRLPLPEALRIARDILAGLGAAHDTGIVHRDVKPENILLDSDGTAKLADFGIAGEWAMAGRGTQGYMAPEQGGRRAGRRRRPGRGPIFCGGCPLRDAGRPAAKSGGGCTRCASGSRRFHSLCHCLRHKPRTGQSLCLRRGDGCGPW